MAGTHDDPPSHLGRLTLQRKSGPVSQGWGARSWRRSVTTASATDPAFSHFSTWGPSVVADPRMGGPVLDPRAMTKRPELGVGPHPTRVRTPEPQPSSMAPPCSTQPPRAPGSLAPGAALAFAWSLGCPTPCQESWMPSPAVSTQSWACPHRGVAAGTQGCLGKRETTGGLSSAAAQQFRVHRATSGGHQGVSG